LVDSGDDAAEVTGQKAASASDIQCPRRRETADQIHQMVDFVCPPGPITLGELSFAQIPLVVLAGGRTIVI
jgi:hypothetical protein